MNEKLPIIDLDISDDSDDQNQVYEWTVEKQSQAVNMRADAFLVSALDGFSRSSVQKLIEQNCLSVNGKNVSKNYKLKADDCVRIIVPPAQEIQIVPQDIPLDIVYEDESLLVVNKPKGMVVHPAPGNYTDTLVNVLMYHCKDSLSGINGVIRPGIVHRIDKNTSGLLIVAKNDAAHKSLAEQIKVHSFDREYEAVVYGKVKQESGEINLPIGRSTVDRKKMCVTEKNSKPAVTYYTVLEHKNGFTHVRLKLKTGRTHQIRVHMAYLGHPVAGDEVYGPKKVITELNGQCLHAKTIGFIHPVTGEYMYFDSPLPDYFQKFLSKI